MIPVSTEPDTEEGGDCEVSVEETRSGTQGRSICLLAPTAPQTNIVGRKPTPSKTLEKAKKVSY